MQNADLKPDNKSEIVNLKSKILIYGSSSFV
jgi:hypothetical protein